MKETIREFETLKEFERFELSVWRSASFVENGSKQALLRLPKHPRRLRPHKLGKSSCLTVALQSVIPKFLFFVRIFSSLVWISLTNVLEQVWITWYCSYPVPLRPQRREVLERPLVQAHPEFGSQNVSFKRRGCQHSPVRPLRPLQRREIPHQPQAAPTHFPAVGSSVFERSRQDWQEIETRWNETEIHYISSGSKSPKLSKPPLASEKGGGAVAYSVLVIVQSKLCIWKYVDVLVKNCKLICELGDLAQAKMRPHIRLSQVVGDSGDPENQREPEGSERDLFKTSERVWIPTNVYILLHCFHIAFVCISCFCNTCAFAKEQSW